MEVNISLFLLLIILMPIGLCNHNQRAVSMRINRESRPKKVIRPEEFTEPYRFSSKKS